jgi:hypothetical protein
MERFKTFKNVTLSLDRFAWCGKQKLVSFALMTPFSVDYSYIVLVEPGVRLNSIRERLVKARPAAVAAKADVTVLLQEDFVFSTGH